MNVRIGWAWAAAFFLAVLWGFPFGARAQQAEANVTGTIAFDTGTPEASDA